MGKTTGISWTSTIHEDGSITPGASWNPWYGCHKVSEGCKNCYMFRDQKRYENDPNIVVRSKTTFNDPLKWKTGRKIFVCSWSDIFIEEADEWRDEIWAIIKATPQHTYQLCTKRIERAAQCLPADWGKGYPNVWLGVTGENQKVFDQRTNQLMKIPAEIHWVSIEPQLERINPWSDQWMGLDWFVVGGESGIDARPFNPEWIDWLLARNAPYKKALFVKQMGSNPVGLKLKHRNGADPNEWEARYRVQDFPK